MDCQENRIKTDADRRLTDLGPDGCFAHTRPRLAPAYDASTVDPLHVGVDDGLPGLRAFRPTRRQLGHALGVSAGRPTTAEFKGCRDRARRMWPVLLTVAAMAAVGCSARNRPEVLPPEVLPSDAPVSCATGTGLLPTASTPLVRMSEGLTPFSVSLVPTVPVPIRIGTHMGFQLSSGTAGYASLYLIDPLYDVQVLAENLPMPAGSLEYPSSQGFTLRATEPVGFNHAILLVTRQPFRGFSGNDTLTTPVSTALDGRTFVSQLNSATRILPNSAWVADEICVRIVG